MTSSSRSAFASLLLLLPAIACGHPAQQQGDDPPTVRLSRGLALQAFIARRERRLLATDTDGDGRISRAEFLASAPGGKGDPGRRFARLDRNRDGAIDRQEIAAAMARRFNNRDADGDGVLTPIERRPARASPAGRDPET